MRTAMPAAPAGGFFVLRSSTGTKTCSELSVVSPELPDDVKENAMNDLVLSIRKDLLSRELVNKTKLTDKDFRHFKAN
jgi:hypothetical protein